MPTLTWIGKDKVVNHHLDVPFRVLEPQYTAGVSDAGPDDSGNRIIHGDNLEALKALLPYYEGRIKCIYIDPPYNTGNENWVYNDNVNDSKIKRWLGKVVGKESEDLSRHDKWLCMMYPRLVLLHKLLADDGVIFISIDDNEQASLKLMMDEVWGAGNFVANVTVVNNFKGKSDDKYIATAHEHLVIYQKGKFITCGVVIPEEYQGDYKEEDDYGKYRLLGLRKRGSNARQVDRPNLFYPVYFYPETNTSSLEATDGGIEILPKLSNGENGTWRWGKDTFEKRIQEIEIRNVRTRNEYDVFQKDYLSKEGIEKRIKPKSFWHGSEFSSEAGTLQLKTIFAHKPFDTPKSVNLLQYCLQQATGPDDIILDSFAGSGTTAHAVLNLNKQDGGNRKFILIEMEDYAETITAERVRRVINGYSDKPGTGGCFTYYKLGEPLFTGDGLLNENLPIERIREYVWYSETRTALPHASGRPSPAPLPKQGEENEIPHFMGKLDDTAYYFYYEHDALTTVDYEFLSTVQTPAGQYVIYADNCLIAREWLQERRIIFKKIPRDISRF